MVTQPLMSSLFSATAMALAVAVALSPAAQAAPEAEGKVKVNFVAPENFADIGTATADRERTQRSLREFLTTLAAKALPDGQALEIDISDIDLAGETRLTAQGDLRVMRGRADWPRINLHYTLRAGDQVLKSGAAQLSDMAYLTGPTTPDLRAEYGYEKRMLRTWFTKTFGKR